MTRIDHTGHNHPMTSAGRTACRRATVNIEDRVAQLISDADAYYRGTDLGRNALIRVAMRMGWVLPGTPGYRYRVCAYAIAERGYTWSDIVS